MTGLEKRLVLLNPPQTSQATTSRKDSSSRAHAWNSGERLVTTKLGTKHV